MFSKYRIGVNALIILENTSNSVTVTMSLGVSGMLSNGSHRMVGSGSYAIRSCGVVPYKMGPTVVKPMITGVNTTVACKSMENDIAG